MLETVTAAGARPAGSPGPPPDHLTMPPTKRKAPDPKGRATVALRMEAGLLSASVTAVTGADQA